MKSAPQKQPLSKGSFFRRLKVDELTKQALWSAFGTHFRHSGREMIHVVNALIKAKNSGKPQLFFKIPETTGTTIDFLDAVNQTARIFSQEEIIRMKIQMLEKQQEKDEIARKKRMLEEQKQARIKARKAMAGRNAMSKKKFFSRLDLRMPESVKENIYKIYYSSASNPRATKAHPAISFIVTANKLWQEKTQNSNKSITQITKEINQGMKTRNQKFFVDDHFVLKLNKLAGIFSEQEWKQRISYARKLAGAEGIRRINSVPPRAVSLIKLMTERNAMPKTIKNLLDEKGIFIADDELTKIMQKHRANKRFWNKRE
jgi:hypothetical protein